MGNVCPDRLGYHESSDWALCLVGLYRAWLRHAGHFFRQLQMPDIAAIAAMCLLVAGMATFEMYGDRIVWPYLCGLLAALYIEPTQKVLPPSR